jgi:cytochrome c-type biogenesis protein CcsB
LRWIETGHGPYISLYEVLSQAAWVSVAFFLLAQKKYARIKIAGFVVMPVSFLLMGIGATNSRDFQSIPASLYSYWLIPHAGFATLAFGSILTATGIAALYILKERFENIEKDPQVDSFYKKLPTLKVMDEIMYRFVGLALIFLTIMIGTGAIWANQTWARYWAWDPIETWSLISWFMYAICLHLRMNVGWSGRRFAWLIIFSIFVLAFSLFGVGVVYTGLHTDYITA